MNHETIKNIMQHPEKLLQMKVPGLFFSDDFTISTLYKNRFGENINLKQPQTFNEKILWLTLHDRRPEYSINDWRSLKYEVKRSCQHES